MDVRQAQAFLAVAEELNFGRAAERLHMAQPPLSRLVRQIETELGARLFDRSTHHVRLTPHGEAILEPARELVMHSRRIDEIVRSSQRGDIGRVRIGFGEAAVSDRLGELARRLRRDRPGVVLELHNSQFAHLGLAKVRDGSLDLLLARLDEVPDADFASRVVAQEELLVALPEAHPLADRPVLTPAELAAEPWIVLPGGRVTGQHRLSAIGVAGGFVPRIVQIAPDSSTLLLLVAAGIGVAPTLSSVRDRIPADGIVFRPFRPALDPVLVRLVWRRGDADPALAAVVELAAEVHAAT